MLLKHYDYLRSDYITKLQIDGVDTSNENISLISAWMCVCTVLVLPQPEGTSVTMMDAYTISTKFTVLYIYIDSYLDNKDISAREKAKFVRWMLSPDNCDTSIKANLLSIRSALELKYEGGKEWLDELTYNTVDSMKIQYMSIEGDTQVVSDSLLKTCLEKGGLTLLTLYRLIYGGDTKEEDSVFKIGSCLQLIDDIVDCTKDIHEEINTYCTFTLQTDTNMDKCARLLLFKLQHIDRKYNLICMGIYLALKYTVLKSHNFTIKLRTRLGLQPYTVKSQSFLAVAEKSFKKVQL